MMMSQVMQVTLRLFGPYAGKTMSINGHHFVDGNLTLNIASAAIAAFTRVMSFYGAFAKGTPEYDAALAAEEIINGGSSVQESSGDRGPDEVQDPVRQNGSEPTPQAPAVGAVPTGDTAENAGFDSPGYRYTDAGVPKFEERANTPQPSEPTATVNADIRNAVMKLDPEEKSHWVQSGPDKGKPKLSAVETSFGRAGLTRQDVESAIPEWNRDKAINAALA
jgi:hypothetical protein